MKLTTFAQCEKPASLVQVLATSQQAALRLRFHIRKDAAPIKANPSTIIDIGDVPKNAKLEKRPAALKMIARFTAQHTTQALIAIFFITDLSAMSYS